jgi:hypothetical protein
MVMERRGSGMAKGRGCSCSLGCRSWRRKRKGSGGKEEGRDRVVVDRGDSVEKKEVVEGRWVCRIAVGKVEGRIVDVGVQKRGMEVQRREWARCAVKTIEADGSYCLQ